MEYIAEKAKGALLAVGLVLLLAWPFLALALTRYASQ